MNGRTRLLGGCLLMTLLGGCDDSSPPEAPPAVSVPLGEAFDPATAGSIRGQVVWQGEVPRVLPFHAPDNPSGAGALAPKQERPNPYAPLIDHDSLGVAGAVVYLRGVDPRRSRPWDLSPVSVEMRAFDFRVRQGEDESRTGCVRGGQAVEFVSRQSVFHAVRARGAAFFTLAFADAGQPRQRVFDRTGIVELSSAAGYFWARANLFVTEHPYFVRTDATGRFTLPQVPPGDYELVCWLPNWHEKERELDSDSWQISRLTFQPPIEETRKLSVVSGKATVATFTLTAARFDRSVVTSRDR